MKKVCCAVCGKYRKFEKFKISCLLEKTLVLSIFPVSVKMKKKKYLKKKNQLKY